jgi:hypothetical protein
MLNYEHPYIQKEAFNIPPRYKKLFTNSILPGLVVGGVAAGVPLAIHGLSEGASSVSRAIKTSSAYEGMFEENPNLQAMRENGDEDIVAKYFNVIKTYAPDMASNPIMASSLVQNMIEQAGAAGSISPMSVQLPIQMQGNLNQNRNMQLPAWIGQSSVAATHGMKDMMAVNKVPLGNTNTYGSPFTGYHQPGFGY